jgi:hypothetical protein
VSIWVRFGNERPGAMMSVAKEAAPRRDVLGRTCRNEGPTAILSGTNNMICTIFIVKLRN